jgi:tRNA dimethylallyltransferase
MELSRQFPAEIISADSRQVYRFMNIGTAKPAPEELAHVPHHFIDICNPDEVYSAGQFGREARARVLEIQQRGKCALIVGGSGLYLRALLEGFAQELPSNRALQEQLKRRAQKEGAAALHAELARLDPLSAQHIHPHDGHRLVRALEVFYSGQTSMRALWETAGAPAPFAYRVFCLNPERPALYARIDRRAEKMLEAGLIEECRQLLARGYDPQLNALQTVGYQEVFRRLRGEIDEAAMLELIQRHSRQYAKRQLTWFRKMPKCEWLALEETETPQQAAARIIAQISLQ